MKQVDSLAVEMLLEAVRSAAVYNDRERLFAVISAAQRWARAQTEKEQFELWQDVAVAAGWRHPKGGANETA